ncbi:MAG TPA: SpoIIE family protein phosphatase, partial [Bacteroidia bacterium]|nr:SpoIIE family protein phosphatase [Bacteroidia bacterium]
EKSITDPGQILNKLHAGVQDALKQGQNEIDTADGMDLSILTVNETSGEILWASAFRPAIIIRNNGELEKLSGNRYSVGGAQLDENRVFTTHSVSMAKGDTIYLFSDGYADQFGGDYGKKLMLKRFQDELCLIHKLPMNEQMLALDKIFETWKGNREQIDDVLVAGIRF